jgi:hypothetical protein
VDDLDPERFVSAEIGRAPRRASRMVGWRSRRYYTWIEDLIVRAPTGETIDELQEP